MPAWDVGQAVLVLALAVADNDVGAVIENFETSGFGGLTLSSGTVEINPSTATVEAKALAAYLNLINDGVNDNKFNDNPIIKAMKDAFFGTTP
jgi:hypothetical protein